MDNGKFVQAIQPAAWARQLSPGDYSMKVHLEITMLLALGILNEKPEWMDESPVIRADGVAWSRYWWPRPLENRELLPAARLPRDILTRILPPIGPDRDFGDLADALYERANHYADKECVERALQAAISQRNSAEAVYLNTVQRARQREILTPIGSNHVQQGVPRQFSHHLVTFPAAPTTPLQPRHPQFPPHGRFGGPHGNMGMPSGASGPHGFARNEPMVPGRPSALSDTRFAMTHGIWPMPQIESLFEFMGTPKELIYQPQPAEAIPGK